MIVLTSPIRLLRETHDSYSSYTVEDSAIGFCPGNAEMRTVIVVVGVFTDRPAHAMRPLVHQHVQLQLRATFRIDPDEEVIPHPIGLSEVISRHRADAHLDRLRGLAPLLENRDRVFDELLHA